MGTSIKLEAVKGENTTKEQWDKLFDYLIVEGFDPTDEDEFITMDIIHCSYSSAYIGSQITEELQEELKGSGIIINLWYEEREPDETKEF